MTPTSVHFQVDGRATAKGNLSAFPFARRDGSLGAHVTDRTKGLRGWTSRVRHAAWIECRGRRLFEGPVRIGIVFLLPRPTSLPKRVTQHTKKPDLDKLTRAVKDALKGVLWHDDAQVTELIARKGYAASEPHVHVFVDHAAPVEDAAIARDLFTGLTGFTADEGTN